MSLVKCRFAGESKESVLEQLSIMLQPALVGASLTQNVSSRQVGGQCEKAVASVCARGNVADYVHEFTFRLFPCSWHVYVLCQFPSATLS